MSTSKRCDCKKRLHTNEESAIGAAIRCSRRGSSLRYYPCPSGLGWHLTKRPALSQTAFDLARLGGGHPSSWQHVLDRLNAADVPPGRARVAILRELIRRRNPHAIVDLLRQRAGQPEGADA